MFCPLEYRESILIFRGLIILIILITLGVSVSQQQLGSLTQRQESLGLFNFEYDNSGNYSIYILGSNYNIKSVYPVGQIINEDKAVVIKTMNYSIKVPTYIEVDCKQELILLDLWARLLVAETFKFKQVMSLYLTSIQEKIPVYTSPFR